MVSPRMICSRRTKVREGHDGMPRYRLKSSNSHQPNSIAMKMSENYSCVFRMPSSPVSGRYVRLGSWMHHANSAIIHSFCFCRWFSHRNSSKSRYRSCLCYQVSSSCTSPFSTMVCGSYFSSTNMYVHVDVLMFDESPSADFCLVASSFACVPFFYFFFVTSWRV